MPKWLVITLVVGVIAIAVTVWIFSQPTPVGDRSKLERTFTAEEQQTLDTREVARDELAAATCTDGAACWLGVDGVVYDMSVFPTWARGVHHDITAGTEATEAFVGSGHAVKILQKMPVVGRLAP